MKYEHTMSNKENLIKKHYFKLKDYMDTYLKMSNATLMLCMVIFVFSLLFLRNEGDTDLQYRFMREVINNYRKNNDIVFSTVDKAVKNYIADPSQDRFNKIEFLFNDSNNKLFIDYVKAASGDKESITNVAQKLRRDDYNGLKMKPVGYLCSVEQMYDGKMLSQLCVEYAYNLNVNTKVKKIMNMISLVLLFITISLFFISFNINRRIDRIKEYLE